MLRARRLVLLALVWLAVASVQGGPTVAQESFQVFMPLAGIEGSTARFVETFDGAPNSPTPWNPDNWDISIHSRDYDTFWSLDPVHAQFGPNCEEPQAKHWNSTYEGSVFQCQNKVATAIRGDGYALVYLTPDHQVDFSQGEAVITWEMSTGRTSTRDWMDVWITPMQDHSQLSLLHWLPDVNGPPPTSVQIEQLDIYNSFTVGIFRNFDEQRIRTNRSIGWETFLTPSYRRLDTFEIRISKDHIRVGMPDYDFYWIDSEISPPLNFDRGVVQFGHHSYNPTMANACKDRFL